MKNKNPIRCQLSSLALALGLLLLALSGRAASYTWSTTAAPATDGTGTWSTGTANWLLAGAGALTAWVNNSDAVIGAANGAAGSITMSGTPQVGNLTLNAAGSGTYIIKSSNLKLNGSPSIFTLNADLNFGNSFGSSSTLLQVGAGNGWQKDGAGTFYFLSTAPGTYTGSTILNAGAIAFSQPNMLGFGALVLNGGTLSAYTNKAALTPAAIALTLTNAVTIGGNVNFGLAVTNGQLTFSGPVTISGATRQLTVTTTNGVLISGAVGDGGSGFGLTKAGSGTLLTLNNTETYSGATTVNAGTLALGASGALAAGSSVNIASGATFDVSALGAAATWNLGASAALTASGSGATPAGIKGGATGTVSLGSRPVTLSFTPTAFTGDSTHPALLVSAGTLSLNGNAFTVTNAAGTALGVGTYVVAQQAVGSVTSAGSYSVVIKGTGLAAGLAGAITVTTSNVNLVVTSANPPVSVAPETAADGSGTLVGAQTVGAGNSITVYAVSRDATSNFVANVAADSWSLINLTGGVVGGDLVPAGNSKSAVFTGNASGTAQIRLTSGALTATDSGTLTVQCFTASVTSPADKLVANGSTGTFTVSGGSASAPAFQWQVSTDSGGTWNNVATGSGGNTASYTTPAVTLADAGKQYRATVSVSCDSSSVTSSVASLYVADPSNTSFRTVTNGNWNSLATWQESPNNGANWLAAIATPTDANSTNILVTSNVTVTASVTADDLLVQVGATLSASGAILTIGNGSAAIDCDVLGIMQTLTGGSVTNAGAGLTFENGSTFNWNSAATPIIPSATWADGSLGKISATAAATVNAIGVSGQNYYDFTWDTTAAGQSTRTRLDLQTNSITTIRRNFSITIPNTATASVALGNGTNTTLTVGGNVTFVTGTGANSTKVLYNSAAGQIFNFKIAGNFSASGYLEGFGPSSTTVEFNGTGAQSLSIPTGSFLLMGGFMGYQVDNGSVVTLNTPISICKGFTVNSGGALNFNSNQIGGGTNLVLNAGGVIYGNGTNQIANVNTNVFGGTLNLTNNFPAAMPNGTSFKLFGGVAYSGAFSAIVPATPGSGQVWDTSQLVTNGTLIVASGVVSTPFLGGAVLLGSNLVLSGTNGTPNTGYTVLTSTNLATAITNWTVAGTGTFSGTGSFSYTNTGTANAQSFFIIRAP